MISPGKLASGEKYDKWLIVIYSMLVLFGILNIYSSIYSEDSASIFSLSTRAGMQMLWWGVSSVAAVLILYVLNPKIYDVMSFFFYTGIVLLLIVTIFLGTEVNGSHSWLGIGPFRFQPAELSKITTSMFLASIISQYGFKLSSPRWFIKVALALAIPMAAIFLEKETGTVVVYAGFIFMLYREGLKGWILGLGIATIILFVITLKFSTFAGLFLAFIICTILASYASRTRYLYRGLAITAVCLASLLIPLGTSYLPEGMSFMKEEYILLAVAILTIGSYFIKPSKWCDKKQLILISAIFLFMVITVFSVEFVFENILQPHQKVRIENLLGINEDIYNSGYNVHQSKIAIGSGGLTGKGYLEGTQTKFNFVPEQSTDFIFCTIGEEWGFLGSVAIIGTYLLLIGRIIFLSERSDDKYTRVYGYCIASIIFMHFFINIGMTIGLVPVIGIPLPFISYGGSSLLSFTVMLFIFIKLQAIER